MFAGNMAGTVIDKKEVRHGALNRYDPNSPEVIERRKELFNALKKGRTPETDAAMNEFADRFLRKFVLK